MNRLGRMVRLWLLYRILLRLRPRFRCEVNCACSRADTHKAVLARSDRKPPAPLGQPSLNAPPSSASAASHSQADLMVSPAPANRWRPAITDAVVHGSRAG
jgi:hypothetical protein